MRFLQPVWRWWSLGTCIKDIPVVTNVSIIFINFVEISSDIFLIFYNFRVKVCNINQRNYIISLKDSARRLLSWSQIRYHFSKLKYPVVTNVSIIFINFVEISSDIFLILYNFRVKVCNINQRNYIITLKDFVRRLLSWSQVRYHFSK